MDRVPQDSGPSHTRRGVKISFAVFDAMVEYTVDDKTSIKLNVTNLTNKLYADTLYRGFYGPGAARAAQLTLKTRF